MIPKLYGLSTCPYCRAERKYLDKFEVAYEYVVVDELEKSEKDELVAYIKKETGGTLFPILEHEDGFIIGFDKKKLIALFDLDV